MSKTKPIKKLHLPFILPAIITMTAVIILPFLFALYIMLNDVNLLENAGKFTFVGLKNFKTFILDPRAMNSLWVTLKFVLGVLTLELFFGVFISMILDREFRFKSAVRALIIIPMFMTPVVAGLIWRTFFDPNAGIISYLSQITTGVTLDFLGNKYLALLAIIIVDLWQWTPFMVLLIMASLDSLPLEILEAAKVEGASEIQTIGFVKLPIIKPTIVIALIMRAIDAMKAFDIIYVMTKGGPGGTTETLNMYTYTVGFNFYRIGYATAISFIFTIIITVVLSKIIQRSQSI